jgi:hypothetical protein
MLGKISWQKLTRSNPWQTWERWFWMVMRYMHAMHSKSLFFPCWQPTWVNRVGSW